MLGTVRNIFTIFAGAFLYGETVTVNEWLGYSVALAGFAAYNAGQSVPPFFFLPYPTYFPHNIVLICLNDPSPVHSILLLYY